MQVYIDGKYFSEENAKISVFDHGFLYGDGIFEGIRVYSGRIFRLEQHIKRFFDSAKSIMLNIPLSREDLAKALCQTVAKNNIKDGYIRLIVSRGEGDLGLNPFKCKTQHTIIIADNVALYPAEFYEKGLEVITAATRRNAGDALSPEIKSLNYLNNIMAQIEAINAGVVEAIMLSAEGYVIECTGDNIFVINNGVLTTPPVCAGILDGITRAAVIELAEKAGIPVKESLLTRHEVFCADECFITGSAAEVVPVVMVDKRIIGDGKPGKITKQLNSAFRKLVQSEGTECY